MSGLCYIQLFFLKNSEALFQKMGNICIRRIEFLLTFTFAKIFAAAWY